MAEVLNVEKSETKNAIIDRIQTNCYLHNREFAVAAFCDLESLTKFRIATDLPWEGEGAVSNEEIGEIYRQRWQIELLWKFLKMHIKLDNLITKNEKGILIQIYSCMIAYLILQ